MLFEDDEYNVMVNLEQIQKLKNAEVMAFCGTKHIQLSLNSSNTDGSFTMANSNLFLSPYQIIPIA